MRHDLVFLTYVLGNQENRLNGTVLLSTQTHVSTDVYRYENTFSRVKILFVMFLYNLYSMRGVLLVWTITICFLLTLDNVMIAKAGTVTKIRKLKTTLDKYMWCCIKKGCPISKEFGDIICVLVRNGIKVDCNCEKWSYITENNT